MDVCPLIFQPILKPRIWGGRRLETVLRKSLPPGVAVGESWEVADLEDDVSVVREGPARGVTLRHLVEAWGPRLLGSAASIEGRFPLLLKFLDAAQHLSVQVHPDSRTAATKGGRVRMKNEAWYVLDAQPDACIYRGFRAGVTPDQVVAALQIGPRDNGSVVELLNRIAVRPGQCYYLPSGTVHALGAGTLVAEVQTPSDVTYRLYDWDRTDPATGLPRELAVKEALACASFAAFDPGPEKRSHAASVWTTVTRLITCPSFVIERVRMVAGLDQTVPFRQLVVWMVLEGKGRIAPLQGAGCDFGVGDTVVLPAELEEPRLQTAEDCVWLEITVPPMSASG